MTGAEAALLLPLIQEAIKAGLDAYDAYQLKTLADLEAKCQAAIVDAAKDRQTANADIDARDKALEAELAKK